MDNNISLLNKADIKSGKLISLIPEFYDLKNTVENNIWHHKQNVFDHTLSVLDNLEKILSNLNKETKQFLNKKVDDNTREDLLRVVALFHDIAKIETIVTDGDGLTNFCSGHDDKGSIKAKKILKRFGLSNKELEFVSSMIKNHHQIHKILSPINQNFKKEFASFKKRFFHSIFKELVLLTFADTIGSYLVKTYPIEYKFRISFYKKEIKSW